jgi:uncharacterized LabA/DUF88 family protein
VSHEIAILIDGGFLTKRLPKLVARADKLTAKETVALIRQMCRSHVRWLTGESDKTGAWRRHIYRIFFYDAPPFEGMAQHPLSRKQINFAKSERAAFQTELLEGLRHEQSVALRLGHVAKDGGWTLQADRLVKLLGTKRLFDAVAQIEASNEGGLIIPPELAAQITVQMKHWAALEDWMVQLDFRQKGVDMRIGLDIASLALKKLAKTIVLIAGDEDFVPAAKLARREGLQFVLDPLGRKVSPDLFEHVDALHTVLGRPDGLDDPALADEGEQT